MLTNAVLAQSASPFVAPEHPEVVSFHPRAADRLGGRSCSTFPLHNAESPGATAPRLSANAGIGGTSLGVLHRSGDVVERAADLVAQAFGGTNDADCDQCRLTLTANTAALSICSAMKDRGIKVYTVGFELSNLVAKTMLTSCATSSSYFYDASSEAALVAAFRDIALKISSLRLTN